MIHGENTKAMNLGEHIQYDTDCIVWSNLFDEGERCTSQHEGKIAWDEVYREVRDQRHADMFHSIRTATHIAVGVLIFPPEKC